MASPMMPTIKNMQGEDGLTQEFKVFLSSLPKENWLNVAEMYQYQGFWLSGTILHGMVKCQTQFTSQPTDLFLVSIPKSGATWLKAMAFATVNRARYPFRCDDQQYPQHPLLTKNPHELIPFVELSYSSTNHQVPDFSTFDSPRLFSFHLPYTLLPESVTGSKCKIVYLCRDPKDTFISLWCFTNKLTPETSEPLPLENMFDMFCKGVSVFGPFWDHLLGYWKESLEIPERVCFLKYEDMKREPMVQLSKLAEFLGCPFSIEEENEGVLEEILRLCSFDNLSNLEVNKNGKLAQDFANNAFFRRGEVGDWVNHLTPEMAERLDRITEENLHGSGLKF